MYLSIIPNLPVKNLRGVQDISGGISNSNALFPCGFPPNARGSGRSSRRKAPSRAALPGRRWGLLQTPPADASGID